MKQLSPDLASLLSACKETPDDDAPRLVLADWLEEHGDEEGRARAEFVRVQCHFADVTALSEDWPRQDHLDHRTLVSVSQTDRLVHHLQFAGHPDLQALSERQFELLARDEEKWL